MEHIAALLLLIGCSHDLADCRELPAPVPIFETEEECHEELPLAVGSLKGQDFRLFAQCVPVDPALEEEDAELFWQVKPDGTLEASVTAADVTVVSNSRFTGNGHTE